MKCYACGKLVRIRFPTLKELLADDIRVIFLETAPRQTVALSTRLARSATSAVRLAIFLATAHLPKRTASQQLRQHQPHLPRQPRKPTRHHPFQLSLQLPQRYNYYSSTSDQTPFFSVHFHIFNATPSDLCQFRYV